jgi:hypothetical protein
MNKWMCGVILLSCVLLSSGPAFAQATEFSRGQTTVVVDLNTITAENNVKFVNYTEGELLTITLNYSATCNIVFSGMTLRQPQPFTPAKGKTGGTFALVSGTPLTPDITGSVTFTIAFSPLKPTGSKSFATAHLNLVLGVDSDCDPATGDASGIDESATIGVQVKVSTASHP